MQQNVIFVANINLFVRGCVMFKTNRQTIVLILLLIISQIVCISCQISSKDEPVKEYDKWAPGEVTELKAEAGDKEVLLTWRNPTDEDFCSIEIVYKVLTSSGEVSYTKGLKEIEGSPGQDMKYRVTGLENNVQYSFKLLTIDINGNKSSGKDIIAIPKEIVDTTPPEKVTDVMAVAGDSCVLISWKAPLDADYRGTFVTSSKYPNDPYLVEGTPGDSATLKLDYLTNGREYTFTLEAIDFCLNKSSAVEIKATPQDATPLRDLDNFTITPKHKSVILAWTGLWESDFTGVVISSEPAVGNLNEPVIVLGNPSERNTFTVTGLENDVEYAFTIKTIDTNNNLSSGLTLKGSPRQGEISLEITLPNEDNRIILTNDVAPIRLRIRGNSAASKVVWKKGVKNVSVEPEVLLNDPAAQEINMNSDWVTVYATENGAYDIAAINVEGICTYEQVEVKTIDTNPLPDVTNLSVGCDGTSLNLSWVNPVSENEYDSPLNNLKITYVYNNDEDDASNGSVIISPTSQNYSINLAYGKTGSDILYAKIQTIDAVGNISEGITGSEFCCLVLRGYGWIPTMTKSGKVIVTGNCDYSEINQACIELRKTAQGKKVRIDLDLTGATNLIIPAEVFKGNTSLRSVSLPDYLEEFGHSAFENCTNLESIKILHVYHPYGIKSSCFRNCTNLKNVTIEEVQIIDQYAFAGCESLEEIITPGGLCHICAHAFENCTNLKKISISYNIRAIHRYAFTNCSNLTEAIFQNTAHQWFKTSGSIGYTTKIYDLGGTSIGYYVFGDNALNNAKLLTETNSDFSLYNDGYTPIIGSNYNY